MFVLSQYVSAGYRAIATFVAVALMLWALGLHSYAQAANVTYLSDLLSDSAPAASSNHTIEFLAPSGVAAGQTMTATFPAGFNLSTVVFGDVDLEVNGTDKTLAATPSGTTWGAAVSGQTLTITSGTDTIGGTATITVKIGTNADAGGTGVNQIVNPTPAGGNQSYQIDIAGTMADSGHTRVVILNTVLVTAKVDTTFNFTVTGMATSSTVNGATLSGTSGSTTLPYGTLAALTPEILGQQLAVTTNAANGFQVTVEQDGRFDSSTGADIDNFKDDVIAAPAAWESPSVGLSISDEKTWGHWGITSEDATLEAGDTFGTNLWTGVTTTPTQVFWHDGPSDGTTANIGTTNVAYEVEISALQEAGDDYSTILTYIATPTF